MKLILTYVERGKYIATRDTRHRRCEVTEDTAGTEAADLATFATEHGLRLHPLPAVPRTIASAEFIARIPSSTWAKVRAAAAQNAALDKALYQLSASTEVHSDNPQLLGMLAALVQGGVITAAEHTQILGF